MRPVIKYGYFEAVYPACGRSGRKTYVHLVSFARFHFVVGDGPGKTHPIVVPEGVVSAAYIRQGRIYLVSFNLTILGTATPEPAMG